MEVLRCCGVCFACSLPKDDKETVLQVSRLETAVALSPSLPSFLDLIGKAAFCQVVGQGTPWLSSRTKSLSWILPSREPSRGVEETLRSLRSGKGTTAPTHWLRDVNLHALHELPRRRTTPHWYAPGPPPFTDRKAPHYGV